MSVRQYLKAFGHNINKTYFQNKTKNNGLMKYLLLSLTFGTLP